MESWGDSSSALGTLCNLCTPSSPGLLGQQAGWVAFPLLFSLSFFFSFPLPKSQSYLFSPPPAQVQVEVEQQEGGTANPSCRPGTQRLGRRENPAKGRGRTREGEK